MVIPCVDSMIEISKVDNDRDHSEEDKGTFDNPCLVLPQEDKGMLVHVCLLLSPNAASCAVLCAACCVLRAMLRVVLRVVA